MAGADLHHRNIEGCDDMETESSKVNTNEEKKKDERLTDAFSTAEGEVCSAEFAAGCISSEEGQ